MAKRPLPCYDGEMTSTLALAIEKASQLPEAAQERIGLDLLERIAALAALRAEIQIGIDQADAGLTEELDVGELLKELNEEHASP
jgi:hypothetical protein